MGFFKKLGRQIERGVVRPVAHTVGAVTRPIVHHPELILAAAVTSGVGVAMEAATVAEAAVFTAAAGGGAAISQGQDDRKKAKAVHQVAAQQAETNTHFRAATQGAHAEATQARETASAAEAAFNAQFGRAFENIHLAHEFLNEQRQLVQSIMMHVRAQQLDRIIDLLPRVHDDVLPLLGESGGLSALCDAAHQTRLADILMGEADRREEMRPRFGR